MLNLMINLIVSDCLEWTINKCSEQIDGHNYGVLSIDCCLCYHLNKLINNKTDLVFDIDIGNFRNIIRDKIV